MFSEKIEKEKERERERERERIKSIVLPSKQKIETKTTKKVPRVVRVIVPIFGQTDEMHHKQKQIVPNIATAKQQHKIVKL